MKLRFFQLVRQTALVGFLLWVTGTPLLFGQDIFQQTYNPYVVFPNVPWGSGNGAMNNNFWFNVLAPEDGVCVWITNQNPTSTHSFTLNVFSTGLPNVPGFTGFTGDWIPTGNVGGVSFPVTIFNNSTLTFFYAARSSSYIDLQFSGTVAAGGSPDTATIVAVMTNAASCSAIVLGNTVIGPTQQGSAISSSNQQPVVVGGNQVSGGSYTNNAYFVGVDGATKGFMVGAQQSVSENVTRPIGMGLNQASGGNTGILEVKTWGKSTDVDLGAGAGDCITGSRYSRHYGNMVSNAFAWASENGCNNQPLATFQYSADTVNPAAGAVVMGVVSPPSGTGTSNGVAPNHVVVSCSVACDVIINKTDVAGTCTITVPRKTWDRTLAGSAATNQSFSTCTVNPTVDFPIAHLWLAAGSTQTYDLSGYWWQSGIGQGFGFDVVEGTAVTGTVSVTLDWMER